MVVQRSPSNLAVAEGVILQNKFSTRSPKQFSVFARYARQSATLQALPLIWLKDCPIEWPHNLNLFPSASARNVQRQLFTRKPKGVSNANIHSGSGRRGWPWTWRNLGCLCRADKWKSVVGTSAPAPELQKVYYYHRHACRYYRRAYRRGYYGGYPGYYGGYYPGYNRGYYGGYYGGYYPRYNRGLFGGYHGW